MLQAIEIWNFEAHEHTRIENLSAGLNVIFGLSNAGKTSIVRALKLPAYNDFDPKSVRVGAKFCKVLVETDKGSVQVTRGPNDNLWEITPKGGNTLHLDKIGQVAAPPQAIEILGMGVVTLGDAKVPVNIMDQLESHFMLAGIGDKKASGSIRAQIIDEISGLSGIEGIIKAVSLDNHRSGREIKQSEKQMEDLKTHLHDKQELEAEGQVLGEAEKHLTSHQEALDATVNAEAMLTEGTALEGQIGALQRQLLAIPNTKLAEQHLDNVREALDVKTTAEEMRTSAVSAEQEVVRLTKAMSQVPDHVKATSHLSKAQEAIDRANEAEAVLNEAIKCQTDIDDKQLRLQKVVKASKVSKHLEAAEQAIENIKLAQITMTLWTTHDDDVRELGRRGEEKREELTKVLVEQDRLLRDIKVCPLNPAHPVSADCLKGVRTPVTKET